MDTRLRELHYKKAIIEFENGEKVITVGFMIHSTLRAGN
ncbi:MAG: hypothetical protein DDT32_00953 [Syntrophomonadaceae bacterium]|nr:hypothetical protein [Bacillota bacterium]